MRFNFNGLGRRARAAAPSMAIGAGIVGVVGATVSACKASTKLSPIMAEYKADMEKIDEFEKSEAEDYAAYGKKEAAHDRRVTWFNAAKKTVKLYAPSIALGVVSVGLILGSHVVMCRRTAGLAVALTTINSSFEEYRGRVRDRFGDDADVECLGGIVEDTIETTYTDSKGKEKTKKEKVKIADPNAKGSGFLFFIDERSNLYNADDAFMQDWIFGVKKTCNWILNVNGECSAEKVYEEFGRLPEDKKKGMAKTMGWLPGDVVDFTAAKCKVKDENSDALLDAWMINLQPPRNIILHYNKLLLEDKQAA